jgi:hypothetical protein
MFSVTFASKSIVIIDRKNVVIDSDDDDDDSVDSDEEDDDRIRVNGETYLSMGAGHPPPSKTLIQRELDKKARRKKRKKKAEPKPSKTARPTIKKKIVESESDDEPEAEPDDEPEPEDDPEPDDDPEPEAEDEEAEVGSIDVELDDHGKPKIFCLCRRPGANVIKLFTSVGYDFS